MPTLAPCIGDHVNAQFRRLRAVAGMPAGRYDDVLAILLGPAMRQPLSQALPFPTPLADDGTPLEFSLAFRPGTHPVLRILFDPGCSAENLADNARVGRAAVGALADSWGIAVDRLAKIEELFFPEQPYGSFALWGALDLSSTTRPRLKLYLNPAAHGPEHAEAVIAEALSRLGHRDAFATWKAGVPEEAPPFAAMPFFGLDLGDWDVPRVKVYFTVEELTSHGAATVFRSVAGQHAHRLGQFHALATRGCHPGRPAVCYAAFTRTGEGPTECAVQVPIRDHVRHDGEAMERTRVALAGLGVRTQPLTDALTALTSRTPDSGRGLIAWLAMAVDGAGRPRVTAYLASEAYSVLPPQERTDPLPSPATPRQP
ncbi:tryptophan dimethylallyltransferase family protein [Streptomyces sp. SYSU K217416]